MNPSLPRFLIEQSMAGGMAGGVSEAYVTAAVQQEVTDRNAAISQAVSQIAAGQVVPTQYTNSTPFLTPPAVSQGFGWCWLQAQIDVGYTPATPGEVACLLYLSASAPGTVDAVSEPLAYASSFGVAAAYGQTRVLEFYSADCLGVVKSAGYTVAGGPIVPGLMWEVAPGSTDPDGVGGLLFITPPEDESVVIASACAHTRGSEVRPVLNLKWRSDGALIFKPETGVTDTGASNFRSRTKGLPFEDGLVKYCDGTTWNPGSGPGLYCFDGVAMRPLSQGALAVAPAAGQPLFTNDTNHLTANPGRHVRGLTALHVSPAAASTTVGAPSSTPVLPDGYDGQRLLIMNVHASNTLVLTDQGSMAGSNLRLAASTLTLGPRDSVELSFSVAVGDWLQIGALTAVL